MIRPLVQDDSREYFELRLQGLQLHPEAFGTGADDWSKATDDQVKSLLRSSGADDFVLGSFHDGKLVGVIGLKREKKHSVGHKGTVWGLFVLPEFRQQGTATALLRALIGKSAGHSELHYLRAIVTDSSAPAIKLFEKCGFEKYGLERGGIKQGGNFFDQHYLALPLRRGPPSDSN